MRRVAPLRPGRAASQNNWSVENLKPTSGSFATTTDQTCQIAKDRNSDGIDSHRFFRATALPVFSQKLLSSGRQSCSTAPDSAPTCSGV